VLRRLLRPERHLVFFSTGLVYGRQKAPFREGMRCQPSDEYGQRKLAAETLVRAWADATGSPVTILRPAVIYGAGAPPGMLLVSLLRALRDGLPRGDDGARASSVGPRQSARRRRLDAVPRAGGEPTDPGPAGAGPAALAHG